MTETTAIVTKPRDVIGKANRRLKTEGQIPAVLYGAGREALAVALDRHDFEQYIQKQGLATNLIEVVVEGETEPVNAIIKEIQRNPVKGSIMHVDFLAVRMDELIQAAVPFHFVGESPGVKEGGVLLHDLRDAIVEALPKDLPDYIEVDVSELKLNETLHISDLVAPEGISIVTDDTGIVCSVTVPTIEVEEVPEGEEGEEDLEPELVGEKGEDAEEAEE